MLPKYLLFVITWYSSYKKSDFWLYENNKLKKKKTCKKKHTFSLCLWLSKRAEFFLWRIREKKRRILGSFYYTQLY